MHRQARPFITFLIKDLSFKGASNHLLCISLYPIPMGKVMSPRAPDDSGEETLGSIWRVADFGIGHTESLHHVNQKTVVFGSRKRR